ncbi:Pycsar system effector family protein [Streptomyces sp. NBC_00338]|uniref:Pycsar system effector family protein n=1 Tax=Streptomyces sp. NBC_00338 TaxID=2975715 RepID=UPI00224DE002|nr:Pycsar system effector family protein [Streptomyces sp. NBC_00338]MCX5145098.1 DUF5706 domain-containing protein [Streptomyces sp. NBC_00338]
MTDRTDTNLDSCLAYTAADLSRTDTKAGNVLALDGLLVAALSLSGTDLGGLSLVLAVAGAVALIGSVVLALLVIRPHLAGGGAADRASYVFFARASPDAVAEALAEDRRPAQLKALSAIAHRKMRRLAHACNATLIAVVAVAAAILAR